jgi:3-hydroxyacyl-CoA dehydrogenase
MAQTDLSPEAIDQCMTLGAGMPMGPLALLDFVGLDVSLAIGEEIGADVPQELVDRVDEGWLGRKTKKGFFPYD